MARQGGCLCNPRGCFKFVEKIDGDLENVIGMPMYKVIKYLEA